MDPEQIVEISCPCCGEQLELLVDITAGNQRYIEDCQVCCRPMVISVAVDREGRATVAAAHEDA